MAYTRPSGSATDFNFVANYARRDGAQVFFSWETGVLRAFGWQQTRFGSDQRSAQTSTAFGTPRVLIPVYADTIGEVTNIGTPGWGVITVAPAWTVTTGFGTPGVIYRVNSLGAITNFGLPHSPYPQTCTASGFTSTQIGSPRLTTYCFAFASIPSTTIPQAYTPVDQEPEATGFNWTAFGTPFARVPADISSNRTVNADGWLATRFGQASAPYNQSRTANGFSTTAWGVHRAILKGPSTSFGTPGAKVTVYGAGFIVPAFGTPALVRKAAGFTSTNFGTPSANVPEGLAQGWLATKFGTPFVNDGGRRAFGFWTGARFGQPTARRTRAATALGPVAQFGTPSVKQRHRVTAIAPITQFGTPQLERNPQC